ncbi:hypothetical protein MTO96_042554 [Rhipicephalus appendiculatus]
MHVFQPINLQGTITWAVCSYFAGTCALVPDGYSPAWPPPAPFLPTLDKQIWTHIWPLGTSTTTPDETGSPYLSESPADHLGHGTAPEMHVFQPINLQGTITWAVCSYFAGTCALVPDGYSPAWPPPAPFLPTLDKQIWTHIWPLGTSTTTPDETGSPYLSESPADHLGHGTAPEMHVFQPINLQGTITWAVCSYLAGTCALVPDGYSPSWPASAPFLPTLDKQIWTHIWPLGTSTTTPDETGSPYLSESPADHLRHGTAPEMHVFQPINLQGTITGAVCSYLAGTCALVPDGYSPSWPPPAPFLPTLDKQIWTHIWPLGTSTTTPDETGSPYLSESPADHLRHGTAPEMHVFQPINLQGTITWAVCSYFAGTCALVPDGYSPSWPASAPFLPTLDKQIWTHIWPLGTSTTTPDETGSPYLSESPADHLRHGTAPEMHVFQPINLQGTITGAVCSYLAGTCALVPDGYSPAWPPPAPFLPTLDKQIWTHIWPLGTSTTTPDETGSPYLSESPADHLRHGTAPEMHVFQPINLQGTITGAVCSYLAGTCALVPDGYSPSWPPPAPFLPTLDKQIWTHIWPLGTSTTTPDETGSPYLSESPADHLRHGTAPEMHVFQPINLQGTITGAVCSYLAGTCALVPDGYSPAWPPPAPFLPTLDKQIWTHIWPLGTSTTTPDETGSPYLSESPADHLRHGTAPEMHVFQPINLQGTITGAVCSYFAGTCALVPDGYSPSWPPPAPFLPTLDKQIWTHIWPLGTSTTTPDETGSPYLSESPADHLRHGTAPEMHVFQPINLQGTITGAVCSYLAGTCALVPDGYSPSWPPPAPFLPTLDKQIWTHIWPLGTSTTTPDETGSPYLSESPADHLRHGTAPEMHVFQPINLQGTITGAVCSYFAGTCALVPDGYSPSWPPPAPFLPTLDKQIWTHIWPLGTSTTTPDETGSPYLSESPADHLRHGTAPEMHVFQPINLQGTITGAVCSYLAGTASRKHGVHGLSFTAQPRATCSKACHCPNTTDDGLQPP